MVCRPLPADYAIANVQCHYESGSEGEAGGAGGRGGAVADHNYGEPAEPPAFIISLPGAFAPGQPPAPPARDAPRLPAGVTLAPAHPPPPPPLPPPPTAADYQRAYCGGGGGGAAQAATDGNRRVRRSEDLLRRAADCVSRGHTFQTVSDQFHIPISTIRFFMARKGILPRRRRGRSSQPVLPTSPTEPPYHMQHYKLPDALALRNSDSNDGSDKPL